MQIEIYSLTAEENQISIDLVAICDSFSSLLWDVEYYQCGSFEVYIAANPQNVETFQLGRIVGRDDDKEHFGIIESVKIETNAEDGDYLTVSGRFLTCLLERRIIYPSFSANDTYENNEEDVSDAEYLELLKESGAENMFPPKIVSESTIAAFSNQYQYNKDYFVGDYVTVEHTRFGLILPKIQLIGMIESFDQNGRSFTPTFKGA